MGFRLIIALVFVVLISGCLGCISNDSITDAGEDGSSADRDTDGDTETGEETDNLTDTGTEKDDCPNDPNKTKPGECGCGRPEGTCGDDVCGRGD